MGAPYPIAVAGGAAAAQAAPRSGVLTVTERALGRVGGAGHKPARFGSRRPSRVLTLLAAILALSVLDLVLTVTHASTIGMAEANPIARAVIAAGSPTVLAAWKVGSLVPIGILCICYRRRLAAELCAWVGLAALLVVTLHWAEYTTQIEIIKSGPVIIDHSLDPRWVVLGSAR